MNYEPSDRAYTARLDHAHRRAALRAEFFSRLQAACIHAAFASPDTIVRTPGSSVPQRPIAWLLHNEIADAELFVLLRDAAQGRDVQLHATLLLSVLAHRFADAQADLALEQAEANSELDDDGIDWDRRCDERRDNERDFA